MSLSKLGNSVQAFLAHVSDDHGSKHALAVAGNAVLATADSLGARERGLVTAAAMLHDVDDRKFFTTCDYANARRLLADAGYSMADADIIVKMIALVSASANGNAQVEEKWWLIPRDADRVEAIGTIGVRRCYEYTRACKRPVALATTPRVTSDDELAELDVSARFIKYVATRGHSASMIDHFYDKLLAIGTLSSGNAYLQNIANQRMRVMREWLYAWCRAHPTGAVADLTPDELRGM